MFGFGAPDSDARLVFLFASKPVRRLSMLEMSVAEHECREAKRFADAVNAARDRAFEAAVIDSEANQRIEKFVTTVRAYPLDRILDLVLDSAAAP